MGYFLGIRSKFSEGSVAIHTLYIAVGMNDNIADFSASLFKLAILIDYTLSNDIPKFTTRSLENEVRSNDCLLFVDVA